MKRVSTIWTVGAGLVLYWASTAFATTYYVNPGGSIQAAIDSADLLGFGFVNLHPQKLFWVLSRFSIELERPVKWQEKITIQTWPKGMDRFFYLNHFPAR